MRLMIEQLKAELRPEQVSLVDGIKITRDDGAWVQILPDADEPFFHLYAEAEADGVAGLLASFRGRLEVIISERQAEEG